MTMTENNSVVVILYDIYVYKSYLIFNDFKQQMKNISKANIQLILGFILAIFGMALLILSFFVPPMGIIDASVLAAIGEVFTFSAALIGIDYHYKQRYFEQLQNQQTEEVQVADNQ